MASYRTLDLFLINLNTMRIGPGNYRSTATLMDWDDATQIEVSLFSTGPIIAINPIKIRMQIEETIESPEEGSLLAT